MRPGVSGQPAVSGSNPNRQQKEGRLTHQSSGTVYTVRNGNGNGNGHGLKPDPVLIAGSSLAHRQLTASQRGALGAQFVLREATITKPTITQVVPIVRVSAPYVQLALHLTAETRARVAMGELSLTDAAKANGLLGAWLAATPSEKVALGVAVGVDNIWDDVIAPSI
jgi:hypothetical protein